MDSDSDNVISLSPVKRVFKRKGFKDSWLQELDFQSWLGRCEDMYKAEYKVCQKTFLIDRHNLLKHMKISFHQANEQSFSNSASKEGADMGEASISSELNHTLRVKRSELMITMRIMEHNHSFNSYNHHIQMLQCTLLPDPNILKSMALKRK